MRRRGKNADIWSWQPATGHANLGDPGCVEGVWMGDGVAVSFLGFLRYSSTHFFYTTGNLLEQEANAEGASERRNTAQPRKTLLPTTTNWALHSEQVKAAPFLFLFFFFSAIHSSSCSRTLRRLPHEYRLSLLLFCFCLQKKVRMLWPNIHPFPLPSPRTDAV